MSSERPLQSVDTSSVHEKSSKKSRRFLRYLGRIGAVCTLAIAGHLSGVAWTHIDTAKASNDNFTIEANIGMTTRNHIRISSNVIDVKSNFAGPPAHGIEARIDEVKPNAIDNFADNNIEGVMPDKSEQDRLTTEVRNELITSYAIGFLATEATLVGAYSIGRRRLSKDLIVYSILAAMIAGSVNGYANATAYSASNYRGHEETGLAPHFVKEGNDTIQDLSEQSKNVQSYIEAFLRTQQNVKQPFNEQDANTEQAIKLVLSSDYHNINWLSTLDSIALSEQADAIIFTGDMLDFGNIEEAEKVGFFKSIEELHVPIIMALGNHDKKSANDTALIDRLQQLNHPGEPVKVVLVEPDPTSHNIISMGGLTISGINDRRYYTDKDSPTENQRILEKSIQDYNANFSTNPTDITLAHQADKRFATSQLTIGGHTHAFAIDGHTITNGSFTSGGLFGDKNRPTELSPSSEDFSVLTIGNNCLPQRLMTVTFRGLRNNTPSVVRTSTLTGNAIATKTKPEGRTCLRSPIEVQTVPKVSVEWAGSGR